MKHFISRLMGKTGKVRPRCCAVVPAAGSSRRMGGENKLMLRLDGIPVLARTLLALERAELVDEIVVATREEDLLEVAELCKLYNVTKAVKVVRGGESRLESVLLACRECAEGTEYIAVHDGARPLVEPALVDATIRLAHRVKAAAPGVPVKDTIKVVADGVVKSTPDRSTLRAIQTPQVFDADLLKAALQHASDTGAEVTDDCSAVELLGKEICLTDGSYENIKITTPEDIVVAESILRRREENA